MRNGQDKMPEALARLLPSTTTVFKRILDGRHSKNPPSKGIARLLYERLSTGEGATLDELYAIARQSGKSGWTEYRHWDGPTKKNNGLGLFRGCGDLEFNATTRRWRLRTQ
jgi:hypothetical protein